VRRCSAGADQHAHEGPEAADVLERSGCRVLFVQQRFLDVDYPALLAPHRPASLEHLIIVEGETPARSSDLTLAQFLLGAATIDADSAGAVRWRSAPRPCAICCSPPAPPASPKV
jgi:hypothetical protein